MLDKKVRDAVLSIIAMEKTGLSPDWARIESEADAAIAYINENGVETDNTIYRFLEDSDARRKSEVYALHQRDNVLKFLDS